MRTQTASSYRANDMQVSYMQGDGGSGGAAGVPQTQAAIFSACQHLMVCKRRQAAYPGPPVTA